MHFVASNNLNFLFQYLSQIHSCATKLKPSAPDISTKPSSYVRSQGFSLTGTTCWLRRCFSTKAHKCLGVVVQISEDHMHRNRLFFFLSCLVWGLYRKSLSPVRSKLPSTEVILSLLQFPFLWVQICFHALKQQIHCRIQQCRAQLYRWWILSLF